MSSSIPAGLEYWTADEIAECLDGISHGTYIRLWNIPSRRSKPLGGDGSDSTTELPIVDTRYTNQPRSFWPLLTEDERQEITAAYFEYKRSWS